MGRRTSDSQDKFCLHLSLLRSRPGGREFASHSAVWRRASQREGHVYHLTGHSALLPLLECSSCLHFVIQLWAQCHFSERLSLSIQSKVVPSSASLFFFLSFILLINLFIQQVLISCLFYTYQCIHVNPNLPIHPTTPPPPSLSPLVSIRLFSTSVSLSLPCKPVHLYRFSRFHIYALIYDICFSLSDLLHSV